MAVLKDTTRGLLLVSMHMRTRAFDGTERERVGEGEGAGSACMGTLA